MKVLNSCAGVCDDTIEGQKKAHCQAGNLLKQQDEAEDEDEITAEDGESYESCSGNIFDEYIVVIIAAFRAILKICTASIPFPTVGGASALETNMIRPGSRFGTK